jgi:hypothetical protein
MCVCMWGGVVVEELRNVFVCVNEVQRTVVPNLFQAKIVTCAHCRRLVHNYLGMFPYSKDP